MKKLKLLLFGLMLLLAGSAQGQLSINLHIGTPPAWGPAGYSNVRYYYLPDVEAYYDVRTSMFIYISNNHWIRRSYLPSRYRNYDLYHGYKVVMNNYHGNSPYTYFKEHRMKYAKGYRGAEQRNNGERQDKYNNANRHQDFQPKNMNRAYENGKGHGNGNNKNENRGHDNGHDNGHGNGKENRK